MKFAAVIPARYQSQRFPGKPLALLNNKPIILHVYDSVVKTELFDFVAVATDDARIKHTVENAGGIVIMTSESHQSGTDRIHEASSSIDADVIINVQGDEPFINIDPLKRLVECFRSETVEVASLMHKISNEEEIFNPNIVKVITDDNDFALYFSRSAIPYNRDKINDVTYWKHIGVYGYTIEALNAFVGYPQSALEKIEKLEQLRFLSNGYKIKMIKSEYKGFGIDTPEDLLKAEKVFD